MAFAAVVSQPIGGPALGSTTGPRIRNSRPLPRPTAEVGCGVRLSGHPSMVRRTRIGNNRFLPRPAAEVGSGVLLNGRSSDVAAARSHCLCYCCCCCRRKRRVEVLTNSGVCWLHKDASRWARLDEAAQFFNLLWDSPIPFIALENPISVISSLIRRPEPLYFPHNTSQYIIQ